MKKWKSWKGWKSVILVTEESPGHAASNQQPASVFIWHSQTCW